MELKDQIRLGREANKLSIEEFADKLDRSTQAVKYWEAGVNIPRPATLRKICELLNIQLSILGDTPDSHVLPSFLADLSSEAIQLARQFDAMPKVIRHAILTIASPLSCYKPPGDAIPLVIGTGAQRKKKRKPTIVTNIREPNNADSSRDSAGAEKTIFTDQDGRTIITR